MPFRCSNSSRIANSSAFSAEFDELVGATSTIVFRVSYSPRVVRSKNLTPRPIFDILIIFATYEMPRLVALDEFS